MATAGPDNVAKIWRKTVSTFAPAIGFFHKHFIFLPFALFLYGSLIKEIHFDTADDTGNQEQRADCRADIQIQYAQYYE